jgi:hypothetical protein
MSGASAVPARGEGRAEKKEQQPSPASRHDGAAGMSTAGFYLQVALVLLAIEAQLVLLILITDDMSLEMIGPALLSGLGFFVSILMSIIAFLWQRYFR